MLMTNKTGSGLYSSEHVVMVNGKRFNHGLFFGLRKYGKETGEHGTAKIFRFDPKTKFVHQSFVVEF